MPAAKRAGGFLNIRLRVVAHAQRKQLHQLAGEVLVRLSAAIRVSVEPHQHRHIAGNVMQQLAKAAQGVAAEERVLRRHLRKRLHLGVRRGKVTVPEQRHLFDERIGRVEQSMGPPCPQVGNVAGVVRDSVQGLHLRRETPVIPPARSEAGRLSLRARRP